MSFNLNFSKSIAGMSPSSAAAFIYLAFPSVSIFSTAFFSDGLDRFGLRWHVLLITCLLSAILIIPQQSFYLLLQSLLNRKLLVLSGSGFMFWLVLMGFVHGWIPQMQSISSAIFLLLMSPCGLYLALDRRRRWRLLPFLTVILTSVILFENFFLIRYLFNGFSFNGYLMPGISPPRIFLNVRDGNFMALIQFLSLSISLVGHEYVGGKKSKVSFCGLEVLGLALLCFLPFFNGFFTGGRALLLALILFLSSFFYLGLKTNQPLIRKFSFQCMVSAVLAWLASAGIQLLAGNSVDSGFDSLVQRGDAGRFILWKIWLESGLSNSILFGHGLGFIPESNTSIQHTPHNVFVQLLSDSGLSGFLLAWLLIFALVKVLKIYFNLSLLSFGRLDFCVIISAYCSIFAFSMFSSPLFWPLEVWCLSVFAVGVFDVLNFSMGFNVLAPCPPDDLDNRSIVILITPKTLFYILTLVIFAGWLSASKYYVFV